LDKMLYVHELKPLANVILNQDIVYSMHSVCCMVWEITYHEQVIMTCSYCRPNMRATLPKYLHQQQ
jgi:hypothetical protein